MQPVALTRMSAVSLAAAAALLLTSHVPARVRQIVGTTLFGFGIAALLRASRVRAHSDSLGTRNEWIADDAFTRRLIQLHT